MTNLTTEEISHIAKLAEINLADEEVYKFGQQLTAILAYIANLSKVDASAVEPLANVIGMKNVFREDVIEKSLTQEEALANAKASHNGYFMIKAIFNR